MMPGEMHPYSITLLAFGTDDEILYISGPSPEACIGTLQDIETTAPTVMMANEALLKGKEGMIHNNVGHLKEAVCLVTPCYEPLPDGTEWHK